MAIGTPVISGSYFQAPSVPTFVDDVSFALDSSYPALGYPGLPLALQKALAGAYSQGQSARAIVEILTPVDLSGYVVAWDAVNQTVRLFASNSTSALAEVATGTNLSTITLRLRILSQ
jgi:hypothetical protein